MLKTYTLVLVFKPTSYNKINSWLYSLANNALDIPREPQREILNREFITCLSHLLVNLQPVNTYSGRRFTEGYPGNEQSKHRDFIEWTSFLRTFVIWSKRKEFVFSNSGEYNFKKCFARINSIWQMYLQILNEMMENLLESISLTMDSELNPMDILAWWQLP